VALPGSSCLTYCLQSKSGLPCSCDKTEPNTCLIDHIIGNIHTAADNNSFGYVT
jgi:hypothetical protein